MRSQVPLFLRRFSLSYFREGACIEYFINRWSAAETISYSLIFSYNPTTKDLHVSRFYPELYLESNPKYMSAACFYLLIHHCADFYALDDSCHISLETVPTISSGFYCRLKDFNFHISKLGLGDVVELVSDIIRLPVDTSMIKEHVFHEDEVPFMK
jgi:hypothetical protein